MKTTYSIRFLGILAALAALLICGACEAPEEFTGEGGLLDSPIAAAMHPDGEYLYVTNANFDLSGDGDGWIAVINTKMSLSDRTDCVIDRILTEPFLGDIEINAAGTIAYVASRKTDRILFFDLTNPATPVQMEESIEVGSDPYMLTLTPDESMMLVTNIATTEFSIVDMDTQTLIRDEYASSVVNDIAIEPGGRYAWITNQSETPIELYDLDEFRFATKLSIGDPLTGGGNDCRGVAFSPDGKYAYVTMADPATLMVLDTDKLPNQPDDALITWLPLQAGPTAIKLSPDNSEIWVTNFDADSVYVIDSFFWTVKSVLYTGAGPYDLAFTPERAQAPNHYYAYVVQFGDHNMSMWDSLYSEFIWNVE